jgi:hypothetical protein
MQNTGKGEPMSVSSKCILIASMDVDPEHEDLFNTVYDTEHIPHLLAVPGVRGVTRMRGEPFTIAIAGTEQAMPAASPIYAAIYEIDGPEVLASEAWAKAVEQGRWASYVRPYTRNRSHRVYRII